VAGNSGEEVAVDDIIAAAEAPVADTREMCRPAAGARL